MKKYRKKLIVIIFGGIGNQLFSYANAKSLAIRNNLELVIDDKSGFKNDHEYNRNYQLKHFNIFARTINSFEYYFILIHKLKKYLKNKYNLNINFFGYDYIIQNGVDYDDSIVNLEIKKNTIIEGYWQSQNYFQDIFDLIRQDLIIKSKIDDFNLNILSIIKSCENPIAIHVRFFDNTIAGPNNINNEYYLRAINDINNKFQDTHYFVFTNNFNLLNNFLNCDTSNFTIINNNIGDELAYVDLFLMQSCKHFIIANSTFSWWGAWLSNFNSKVIISPGFEKEMELCTGASMV